MASRLHRARHSTSASVHTVPAHPHHESSDTTRFTLVGIALLIIATVATYSLSLRYPFQFDDLANISKHFNIRHYSFWALFFSGTRWISYWLNSLFYRIGDFNPFVYRLGSLTIHLSNGLLVFAIMRRLLRLTHSSSFFYQHQYAIAWTTSLLFLLHPVQTQTVSYVIQGQLEGLAALASLSMIFIFFTFCHAPTIIEKSSWLAALLAVSALSCGTKEISIVAPFLLLLIDWFFVAHGSIKQLASRWFVHLSVILTVFSIYLYLLKPTFFAQVLGLSYTVKNNIGNVITHDPQQIISPVMFFLSEFKVILHYLWMFIWPFNISVEYDWKLVTHPFAFDCIIPFAILAFLAGLIIYTMRSNRTHPLCFGALWFALCLAPRSTIMPSPELIVDYKTYLASIGWLFILSTLLVSAAHWLIERLPFDKAVSKYVLALLIIAPLSAMTISRNFVWRSGTEFWDNMIKNAPGKARAYNNYGVELSQNLGKFAEAVSYFKQAIAMDDNYADPCNNLAVAYFQLGKMDEAIAAMQQGLRINHYYPEGYNNLASFFMKKGDYTKAKETLQYAIKLRPYYGKAHFNLGRAYLEENNIQEAYNSFKNCCTKADLDHEAIGFLSYGKTCVMLNKLDEAVGAYTKALSFEPNNPECYLGLSAVFMTRQEYHQAANLYRKILSLCPTHHVARFGLAETYFLTGEFKKALETFLQVKNAGVFKHPSLYIHIASCLERLGAPLQAKQILTELLALNPPAEVATQVQNTLDKFNTHYNLPENKIYS